MKFAVGQPVTRIEDTRLITGQGKFTDDQKLPGMVHGVFARSPYAHAKIISIDIEDWMKGADKRNNTTKNEKGK